MRSKEKLLWDCRLYLILDTQVYPYETLFDIAKRAIPMGVDIVQLRDKSGSAKDVFRFSKDIIKLTKNKIPYIINDRVDLAIASKASGVHLGQDDISIALARKMMGEGAIIGASCQTWAHAKKAVNEGADYLGFGSVFKTLTKPDRNPMDLDLLSKVFRHIKIPVFAIGGIRIKDMPILEGLGVTRVAVCRGIGQAKNIQKSVRAFKNFLRG